jgi:hypothetical protein
MVRGGPILLSALLLAACISRGQQSLREGILPPASVSSQLVFDDGEPDRLEAEQDRRGTEADPGSASRPVTRAAARPG